ncbi:MAG: hypothetical protein IKS27_05805 [Oscillospiraceae bacterium]|nr:hypothetical protein [Oscillospiraceae bacterium]
MKRNRGPLTEREKAALTELLDGHVTMTGKGFAIDLAAAPQAWDECLKTLGAKRGYAAAAEMLNVRYREAEGRDYLFTDRCLAFEIAYHANAFFRAVGIPGYRRHVTTLLFSREALIEHCKVVDISTDDISVPRQRIMFRYRSGVRPAFRGTDADPFDRRPFPARLLRPCGERKEKR